MIIKEKILLTSAFLFFLFNAICPHPNHVFVDVSMKFIIDDASLVSISMDWEMDEINSELILKHYDENSNGAFDKDELLKAHKYFNSNLIKNVSLTYGLKFIEPEEVKSFNMIIINNKKVFYSFEIPCDLHVKVLKKRELTILVHDATMEVGFKLNKDMIKVSQNEKIEGIINFSTIDNTDVVIFRLKKKRK